jgi:FKBP-type peptidyl-prolyl cis-trans isomerase
MLEQRACVKSAGWLDYSLQQGEFMKLFSGILTVILTATLVACSPKPKTQEDQVSYTIGAQFGRSIKNQDLKLDPKMLAQGIEDALKKDKLQLSDDEMQAAMMKMNEERQKTMTEKATANKAKAAEFMEKNKSAEGVKTTASGLQYKILTEGTGPSPKDDQEVVVHYKGTLIDGTEFDSSHKRNQPAEFPLKGIIPGWTEGLQLMKKGGKAMLYVPPELGYQDRPRQTIPPNSVLIFEVELIDVKNAKAGSPAGAPRMPPGKRK